MKRALVFFCLLFYAVGLSAQGMEAGILLGFQHTLAQRGPHEKTEVSDVKFVKPVCRSFGLVFDARCSTKFSYGVECTEDVYDYGYEAKSHHLVNSPGIGLASGMLGSGGYITIYRAGARVGHKLYSRKKMRIKATFIPSMGYYKAIYLLSDTFANSFWRKPHLEIQYINSPTYQREGIYFFLKGGLEFQYQWSQRFATSFSMAYQQGFKPFVIDTTNIIRRFEPTGPKEHKYWTSVNGTALQWHFGFKYLILKPGRQHNSSSKSEM